MAEPLLSERRTFRWRAGPAAVRAGLGVLAKGPPRFGGLGGLMRAGGVDRSKGGGHLEDY